MTVANTNTSKASEKVIHPNPLDQAVIDFWKKHYKAILALVLTLSLCYGAFRFGVANRYQVIGRYGVAAYVKDTWSGRIYFVVGNDSIREVPLP